MHNAPDDGLRFQRCTDRTAISHRPLNAGLNDTSRGESSVKDCRGNRRKLQLGTTCPGRARLARKGAGIEIDEAVRRRALRELPQEVDCARREGQTQTKRKLEPKRLVPTIHWIEQVRSTALHCKPNIRRSIHHQYSYTNGLCGVCFAHESTLLLTLDFSGHRKLSAGKNMKPVSPFGQRRQSDLQVLEHGSHGRRQGNSLRLRCSVPQ